MATATTGTGIYAGSGGCGDGVYDRDFAGSEIFALPVLYRISSFLVDGSGLAVTRIQERWTTESKNFSGWFCARDDGITSGAAAAATVAGYVWSFLAKLAATTQ